VRLLPLFALATLLPMLGCVERNAGGDGETASPGATSQAPPPHQWLGQWTGPEGTFLRIAGGQGKYEITVQNLDGPRTFTGTPMGDRIQFERDGAIESIRATDGRGTGMKWLGEKTDCLTVRPGEGYCRD